MPGPKATIALWGPDNSVILVGHEDGSISTFDPVTGDQLKSIHPHELAITDIQFSPKPDKAFFISSSKDSSAKIFETETLQALKTYKTDRPVNSASIGPLKRQIILGGGQEAMAVTTTSARQGKFEVQFYHMVFEDEIGRVKGHFGPVNSLAWMQGGEGFVSGGEDGYIRVHFFDDDYWTFSYDEEEEL